MQTTTQIISTLQAMLQAMFKQSKEKNQDCVLMEDMLTDFHNLASENPVQNPFFLSDLPSAKEVESLFANIERHASASYTMPYMPISYFKDNIQGKDVYTPAFLPWQTADNKVKNFIINYDNSTAERAAEIYKHMLMSILLGLPPKSVHLSFVNTQFSSLDNFFTSKLNESLYEIIATDSDYRQLLSRLQNRMKDFKKKYGGTIEQENESAGKIVEPYEVVILLDDPDAEISAQEQLIPLFEKGPMSGIYFIGLNSTEKVSKRDDQDNILKHADCYHVINAGEVNSWKEAQKNAFISTGSIANNNVWAKAAFDYINNVTTRQIVHTFDWKTAVESPYTPTDNEIIAPIGFTEDGTPFNFQMDINHDHTHAFVIGATGSGKSRFLHDVILSLTAKYSPEDLELYLLDFKGVEFNCYRGLKHARAILVDGTDEVITSEVVQGIKDEMYRRQQLFTKCGASYVDEFNQMNTGEHLTQIVFIADECQTLFEKLNEIVKIITDIASKGRTYGIHLLLCTQTISNAQELRSNGGILSQITEHYILPCKVVDAQNLVEDHKKQKTGKIVAEMEKGKGLCYYEGTNGETLFSFNFVQKGEMQDSLLHQVKQKAASCACSHAQAYFSGALQFSISHEVADYIATKGRRNIIASPGQQISLDAKPLTISLKDGMGENIVLFGINNRHYVTRTTIGLMTSLMISNKQKDLGYQFMVFDCLEDEEAEYLDVLDELEAAELCEVVKPCQRIEKLKQLCDEIASHRANPTILVILAQERFRELKYNAPIVENNIIEEEELLPGQSKLNAAHKGLSNMADPHAAFLQSQMPISVASINSVQDAMNYILTEGPTNCVHTILQVDKPDSFLFPQDGQLRKENLYAKCKHVVLLRSEFTSLTRLSFEPQIQSAISNLEDNPDRLRAYYYDEGGDTFSLFSPYLMPNKEIINNIIK